MTETARLVIKVDSSGADRATRSLDKLDRAAGGTERAANKLGKAWGVALGVIGSAAVIGATRGFIRLADESANLRARLALVTKSQEEFNTAQRATFEIAQRSSTELGSVVDLYAKLAQSTGQLGASQAQLVQLTETITQTFQISGATAQEASGGLRQLSQAMAGGVLRAEEFNSIIESSPRLVQALADGMGIEFGKVRAAVNEGTVSSEILFNALLTQSEKVQSEFNRMPITVGRATQQVRNALQKMVGDADEAEGASKGLAESIEELARTLESPEVKEGFATIINGMVETVTWATKATSAVGGLIGKYNEWLGSKGFVAPGSDASMEDLVARRDRLEGAIENASGTVGEAVFGEGTADKLRLELDEIERRIAEYGVNVIRPGDSTPDSILKPRERATGNTPNPSGGGDEKAAKKLQEAYDSLSASQREQIALHGEVSEAAKIRYAIENTELSRLSDAQKASLVANAEEIDRLEDLTAIEQVWAEGKQLSIDLRNAEAEAAARHQDEVRAQIDDMEFELSLIGKSNEARAKAIALRYAGVDAASAEGSAIARLAVEIEKANEAEAAMLDVKRATSDLFADIISGTQSAGDAFEEFGKRIVSIAAQVIADKAVQAMFSGGGAGGGAAAGGGFWGSLVQGIAGYFGGGRAGGGPVMAGQSYLVGEHGPEVVTFGQNGRVSPNAQQGGGQPVFNFKFVGTSQQPESTSASRNSSGGFDVEMIFKQIEQGIAGNVASGTGPMYAATKNRFALRDAI